MDQLDWLARRLAWIFRTSPGPADAPFLYDVVVSQKSATTPASLVAPSSGDRKILMFGTAAASTATIQPQTPQAINQGIALVANNPNMVFTWDQHKALVSAAWYGFASPGPVTITVVEVIYHPERVGGVE